MPKGVYDHFKLKALWQYPEYIKKQSDAHKGHTPSKESIKKGIESRKNNGRPWHSEEARKKLSTAMVGDRNPMKRPEVKEKMKISCLGKRQSKETREKKVETRRNNGQSWFSEEVRKNISLALEGRTLSFEHKRNIGRNTEKLWQDPEYVSKQMVARGISPNKAEILLDEFFQDMLPNEYKFTGDGKDKDFIIAGKCPDFVNINGQKKIIELFGEHVHKPEEEQQRIDIFAQHGYQTLIIWYSELKDVSKLEKRILEFNYA